MARIVLGQESEKKLRQLFLSNNTVQRRISDLADHIKQQVISDIKTDQFGLFSIQLDESTDVSVCSQHMVVCIYYTNSNIKEELLFCSALETITKAASSMLRAKNGFQTLDRNLSPSHHCSLHGRHRQALASKTLPEPLHNVLKKVIKTVN